MNPFYNAALTFGPLTDDLIGIGEIHGEAGAAGTSFFGPVGIGADTPVTNLHVQGSAAGFPALFTLQNTGSDDTKSQQNGKIGSRPGAGCRDFRARTGATRGSDDEALARRDSGTAQTVPGSQLFDGDAKAGGNRPERVPIANQILVGLTGGASAIRAMDNEILPGANAAAREPVPSFEAGNCDTKTFSDDSQGVALPDLVARGIALGR